MVDLITPAELAPTPRELVLGSGTPETIAAWKALAESLLTDQPCVFHRNLEISSRYAWIYKQLPACFKWAGMAAFASHHARLALYPFRLDTDRTGYADIPHSLASPAGPAPGGREHDPRDEQRHLRRHLLGARRLRLRGRRDRTAAPTAGAGAGLRPGPRWLRGDRPRTPGPGGRIGVRAGSTGGCRPHLGGQHPAPRARAARPGAAPSRPPVVRVRPDHLHGLGSELRGSRPSAGALLLLLLLRLRVRAGDPANPAGPRLAEDHPLRRPLEVDRDLHRPALPEARDRRAPGRRQPAPHPRRQRSTYASKPCVLPRPAEP